MERIELTVKEYDAVFTELRQCMVLQYTVLGGGMALLGAIVKELLGEMVKGSASPASILLGAVLSGAVDLVIVAWAAEVTRMRRNAVYLIALEKDLVAATAGLVGGLAPGAKLTPRFGFHSWAASDGGRGQLRLNYVLIFGILVVIGALGALPSVLGALQGQPAAIPAASGAPDVAPIVVWLGRVAAGAHIAIVALVMRRLMLSDRWDTHPSGAILGPV